MTILLCGDPNHSFEIMMMLGSVPAILTYALSWLRCRIWHRKPAEKVREPRNRWKTPGGAAVKHPAKLVVRTNRRR